MCNYMTKAFSDPKWTLKLVWPVLKNLSCYMLWPSLLSRLASLIDPSCNWGYAVCYWSYVIFGMGLQTIKYKNQLLCCNIFVSGNLCIACVCIDASSNVHCAVIWLDFKELYWKIFMIHAVRSVRSPGSSGLDWHHGQLDVCHLWPHWWIQAALCLHDL